VNSALRISGGLPAADWNLFVDAHPAGTVFHRAEWAAVYDELPWTRPHFLTARREGVLAGILPLAVVDYGLGRRAVASAPYCVEAGVLAVDPPTRRALEDAALDHARALGARFLELRPADEGRADWPRESRFSTFCRILGADEAACLAAIPRKQRAMVRKGEAAGLAVMPSDDMPTFYRLYTESVRNLGTPAYHRDLFAALRRHFGERATLHAASHAGEAVAMVMSFWYRGRVLPYFAGSLPRARALKAYDFLYWQLMREALARGCREFDFGRSLNGSGAHAFKRNWGFEPRPLVYQRVAVAAGAPSVLDPDAPFNRLARAAWRHLPLAVANRLGPWLSRQLW